MSRLRPGAGLLAGVLASLSVRAQPIPVPTDFLNELWYKNSLVYNLDVEVFKDSDNDGIGDFNGLTQQLGYLKNLGVDVIWLSPFQPTPNKDDGYDVSDFYRIDKRLGTERDFQTFMQQASRRDIRVMMDLVINHTSNEHPWFKEARRRKDSPYRSWYVWSKERPKDWNKGMVFPGVQTETWSYDSLAGEYFHHRFYRFQPDLNAQNPAVQTELRNVIRHWLKQGMAGFRLDAVPFFIEIPETGMTNPKHQYEMIPQLRQFVQWHKADAVLLGEINVEPNENKQYFGAEGGGLQMMFNFFANQHLFYAMATGDAKPLVKALEATQGIPVTAQWANFLRNHDEIDLGRLSNRDRAEVYKKFGPDTNMQLYDRGIRRRLAPMLQDPKLISLAYSLLFSLPGTPVLRYGEEIGMGDDLTLNERNSVRTPMQWSGARQGGFSGAAKTVRPVISKGAYAYAQVNVARQLQEPNSLLNQIRGFRELRKKYPGIGLGDWSLVDLNSSGLLAIRYEWEGRSLLMVHNLSTNPQEAQLPAELAGRTLTSLLKTTADPLVEVTPYSVRLDGYGYGWFLLGKENKDTKGETSRRANK